MCDRWDIKICKGTSLAISFNVRFNFGVFYVSEHGVKIIWYESLVCPVEINTFFLVVELTVKRFDLKLAISIVSVTIGKVPTSSSFFIILHVTPTLVS